ncbi:HEAT repeat domain-containing protein [Streptomyces sp. 3N207]|uniref:HEAT repeat domain-containing protein n=1 Tax=Streptomyces sp. 3N207 TaxID=3457417 RepID=UPI003FD2CD44
MLSPLPHLPAPHAPAYAWVAYDLAVRREWYWIPDPHSRPERPSDPAVALCHGDGRVREAALRTGVPGGLLPLVALRCADWAGPVREAARRVLADAGPEALVRAAHVVLHAAARKHGGAALRLLETRLAEGGPELRESAFAHPLHEVRRWAYRQAVDNGWLTPEQFAHRAVRDPDVVVQARCAEAALAACPSPVPPGVLDVLLGARSARVRAIAVTALRRLEQPLRGVDWLADRSPSVRACAQWAVRQGGGDPLAHYRRAAAAAPGRARHSVVAGLGECGGPGEIALVLPYLSDVRPGVRAAAVGALRALGAASPERVAPLLDDPSPAVVRRVCGALLADADALPPDALRARSASDRPRHIRLAALRLLAVRRGLAPLRTGLALVDDSDPDVRVRARTLVTRWATPDSAALAAALPAPERARLTAEIDHAAPTLGPSTVRFLHWILQ